MAINIKDARQNLDELALGCLKNNDVITIKTDNGKVVIMSEAHYNNLKESLYLVGIKKDIEEVINTPTEHFSKIPPFDKRPA
jgi:PHD/YefM family antitoxin component YafN of YafNO toxin-antitoxin module